MFANNFSLLFPFIFRASESFTFFSMARDTEFTGTLLLYVQKNVVLGLKLFERHQRMNATLC